MKIEREIVNLHFNTNHSIVEVQHDTDAAYCLKIIYSRQHNSHPHYSLQRPKQPQIRTHMIPKWRQKTVELARKLPLSQIRASHSECGDAGLNNFFGKLQNFCLEIEKNGEKKNNKKLWQNVRKWKLFFQLWRQDSITQDYQYWLAIQHFLQCARTIFGQLGTGFVIGTAFFFVYSVWQPPSEGECGGTPECEGAAHNVRGKLVLRISLQMPSLTPASRSLYR